MQKKIIVTKDDFDDAFKLVNSQKISMESKSSQGVISQGMPLIEEMMKNMPNPKKDNVEVIKNKGRKGNVSSKNIKKK